MSLRYPLHSRNGEFLRDIGDKELNDLRERKAVRIDHFRKGRRVKRVTLLEGEVAVWPSALVHTTTRDEFRTYCHRLDVCLHWNRTPGIRRAA